MQTINDIVDRFEGEVPQPLSASALEHIKEESILVIFGAEINMCDASIWC